MRAVVSDTSVLNYLALVGSFDLFRDQFGQIIVREAVLAELVAKVLEAAGETPQVVQ